MTNFDVIRNLIIDYEVYNQLTKDELLDKICEVCFARKLKRIEDAVQIEGI